MKKLLPICIFLCLLSLNIKAQDCDCKTSFNWMVNTFEKNDAGFQYVIDKKGLDDYQKHTNLFKAKVENITNINECQQVMRAWLKYFRPGHVGVIIKQATNFSNTQLDNDAIRLQYKDTRTINLTEKQLQNLLKKKANQNPIEGIWTDGNYTLGIVADATKPDTYSAFIIKADSVYWMPKQLKAELKLNPGKKTFTADYYMQNHSKQIVQAQLVGKSNNLLLMNGYWQRKYTNTEFSKQEAIAIQFSKSTKPFVEKMSDKTVYLRIPSFQGNRKKEIDSTLAKHDSLIRATPNLIIDIRYGTGGSDYSYSNIIPYLYTHPIRIVGVQIYATELNAQAYEKYAANYPNDTARANSLLNMAKKIRLNLGKFIDQSSNIISSQTLPAVLPYPQNVAVICNQNNGSTDEQFLLAAKQSRKVKVFGSPTMGALDISNMNFVDSPDGKFQLGYCMSKSYRIPNFVIDGVGIQPDYFIDDFVDEDWISYTQSVIEKY